MTILVDLDNVLVDTGQAWIDTLNECHGTTVKYDDISEWDVAQFFPTLTRDEVYEPLSTGAVWSRVSPIPGARDALEKMMERHTIYVVTSSSLNTIGQKWKDVLQKFFPMIRHNNVIVAHNKQMIDADILIDDAAFNIEGGKYLGILFDAPHNRNCAPSDSVYARVSNWDEAYSVVCTIEELMNRLETSLKQQNGGNLHE